MLNVTHPEYTFKKNYKSYSCSSILFSTSCVFKPYTSGTNSSGIFMGFYQIDIYYLFARTMKLKLDVDSTSIILGLGYGSNFINGIGWIDFIPMMNCSLDQKYLSSVHECQFCAKGEYLNISANTCENCTNIYDKCT